MASLKRLLLVWTMTATALAVAATSAHAQGQASPPADDAQANETQLGPTDKLALEEQRIAEKYKHLEDVLLRMAELNAATDPRRAALLKKVVAQSKEKLVAVRFDRLVDLLGKDQLAKALENQTEVDQDLRSLLELLLSENRAKHIESEKARIREFLKQINGLIKQEKDIQGRTTGGDDAKRLAGEQANVAEKAGQLAEAIRKNDAQKNGDEAKADDEQKRRREDGGQEDKDAEKTPGAEKNGESGDGKEGDGEGKKPSESGTEQQPQQQAKDPTHKRIEAAQQRMKEAEAKLKEAQRRGAVEKQEEAILELQMAKAKLEEILRQLREEEVERMLAMLEARFRKMLEMQEEVYEGTVRLDKVPSAERTHSHEIESSRLSGKESQIVVEIDKALLLLRDDGSAVAFLEASQQMRDDMQEIVERLAQTKVGQMTQSLEEDVIAALKEMIEAFKKAQKDKEKKKAGQQSPGQQQDPPLVDVLAELKMIRALQMRVNTRTARYSKMIEGEQVDSAELVAALKELAQREQRIHQVTRDLQMGKNQ